MNESILNHLFLPHYLPSSADDDFLIQNNHQNEHILLECMKEYISTVASTNSPVFDILADCVRRWSVLQSPKTLSVLNLQSTIGQLPPGSFLPLYFHAQNAAILIEMDENNPSQPLIAAWQVLLPMTEITSCLVPHLSYFPVTTYRLPDRSQLISKVHCELLLEFMYNTIEYSKSYKSSHEVDEIREVPESHYVYQWWVQHFDGVKMETTSKTSVQFKKKHRDQIRWNKAKLPFRRSGLWMTIKVVFHIILTKRLGEVGTIVYKLLITHFLTYILQTKKRLDDFKISTDLLIHCTRKIVRRLNKIDSSLKAKGANNMTEWIEDIRQQIQLKINQILPKSNWQNSIRLNEEKTQKIPLNNLKSDHTDACQHSLADLKAYLQNNNLQKPSKRSFDTNNYNDGSNVYQMDFIPSFKILAKRFNYIADIILTRMEVWVELHLEQWIDRASRSHNGQNSFELLSEFFEDYQRTALECYHPTEDRSDPMGYSRFMLTCLTIVQSMHRNLCNDKRFKRLQLHSIDIPNLLDLFQFLILPTKKDMIRARLLYNYFDEFNQKPYPDLLSDITSKDAFGVYFADQSLPITEIVREIQNEMQRKKQLKIQEVNAAKEEYRILMDEISRCLCECRFNVYTEQCHRCELRQQAKAMKVEIYECPLPSNQECALAVIFELQMPIEIRCYRDTLWQFINRANPSSYPKSDMYEWLSVPPHNSKLRPFYSGPHDTKVKLISSVKSTTQTHYSTPSIASTSLNGFIFESSLNVQISPTYPIALKDECRILTPHLYHPDYEQLRFTVNNTHFVQNQVIAKLSDCPSRVKPMQFVEFGSFRSGHRLQWWNLLTIFEIDSLPIAEESVAILIIHSILQCGPFAEDLHNNWCSESHQPLLEDYFVDELILRLNRHLDDCKSNWQNELVLLVITMITMRILTICNSTRQSKVADLVLKCRKIGELWIDLISEIIQTASSSGSDELDNLRLKLITIGISCRLTFSIETNLIRYLLSSDDQIVSLLKATTTVNDNIILNQNHSNISIFLRDIIKYSERSLIMIQPTLAAFLQETSYESLNTFVTMYSADIKSNGEINGNWTKRTNDFYDGWYDGEYESSKISIDCVKGTFLINGLTIGFLPKTITSNKLFLRLFGTHIFEVQATPSSNSYITKHAFHGNGRVHYEFRFNDRTNRLTINERHIETKDVFHLIPHYCLKSELADTFVTNHSHWMSRKTQQIEFRSVYFKDDNFLDNKPYQLTVDAGYITTLEYNNAQLLVNRSSSVFQDLFHRYFSRLDDESYVYMMKDNTLPSAPIIHIHLSRLGIAFKYDVKANIITSREYPDMCIEKIQWLGTLTGLKSGLLLSPSFINNQKVRQHQCRKLIIPFGEVHAENIQQTKHQTVSIRRTSLTTLLARKYFVFIINDRLKILQPTDNLAGWLYLALLHAMTSNPLPDQYTGMTGMERAFQLLNSAACWSDQPFDILSLNILSQIAAISPRVNYYPEHLTCMIKIDWNINGIPYSMQHFGYYLIAKKLVETSQQLSFMHPSSISDKLPEINNEKLLAKLYWDYRDSYNPFARLSAEMETDTLCAFDFKPYQPALKYSLHVAKSNIVLLMDDLYNEDKASLKDRSTLHWLPLSKWLTDEYKLKNIWPGLLKNIYYLKREVCNSNKDTIQRFEVLLHFLHCFSEKLRINPFHIQMLKTAFKVSTTSLESIIFPRSIPYDAIEKRSVEECINLSRNRNTQQQKRLKVAVEYCLRTGCSYDNRNNLTNAAETAQINTFLAISHPNNDFRSFLKRAQNIICSVKQEEFNTQLPLYPQQFGLGLLTDHYQIQIISTNRSIDRTLLHKAEQKFHYPYSDHFDRPTVSVETVNRQDVFSGETSLNKIAVYFKNQLEESWNKLISDKQIRKADPSVEEINELLNSFRQESSQFWKELIQSIVTPNDLLFKTGVVSRFTPTSLISQLQHNIINKEKSLPFLLSSEQYTLLGGLIVNWTLEQQLERALNFSIHDEWEDFRKEISNIPHSNWIPSEHILWLILEVEMNITIRATQINVTRHMMQSNIITDDGTVKNLVMQMNMGEGKTSVILPMLALSLSSSDCSLVRIIVLKSLFPTNYRSLRYKLGGLLNRRIFSFASRRDMNFNSTQINQIFNRLKQGLRNYDVILTSPEDILSFELLTIDKCRRGEFDVGCSMLKIQRWLREHARDVLDESDEILHVKYQLIYTVGSQQQVDAGAERWKTIQAILELVKTNAANISEHFDKEVCYKSGQRKSAFPQFRLQSHHPFLSLCKNIADDWLDQKSFRQADKKIILSFILKTDSSVDDLVDKFSSNDIQLFLMIRGLLSSEVLLVSFKKRYRVNYGVNPNSTFNRLMAVPFRAKDVVADRTEFGHPDVALVLTQLSYYYSGLNDHQLIQCFDRLNGEKTDPASIYDQWILYEQGDEIPEDIKQWKGVNLKDDQQKIHYLFPILRYNMLVVNYFLNNFVYPREAKQFPHKLVASAWDLSSSKRSKTVTGFSGTSDTQLLLPIHIRQCNLPELQKTDAIVVNNLLQSENESYQYLPINASSNEILNQILNSKEKINVILDVGALFIDGTNRDIAIKWLNLSDKNVIDYAVYFDSDSIFVCDRQYHHHRFETSPASERLDHCVFYLDEIHTRGADFKFPKGFRAAVTLGNGLTKDRFVQACMRMRKLGNGHSLTFWSSHEVHQQITINDRTTVVDILRWVYENTVQSTWDGLHHWALQSLSFQRKLNAFQCIDWKNQQQLFTDAMLDKIVSECLESEVIALRDLYGASKILETVFNIYSFRSQRSINILSKEIHDAVLNRLRDYGGTKQRLSQLLGEEQQRELEQEFEEERQEVRLPLVDPCQPILHDEIKELCEIDAEMNLSESPVVFQPLAYAFRHTTFYNDCQSNGWRRNLWVSTEFQRVIQTKAESLNLFLRPPRWILVYRNQHIIFISPLEANWLMGRLNTLYRKQGLKIPSITTLRLLLPRTKRIQSIFVNTPSLTIPPTIESLNRAVAFTLPLNWLAQLFVFIGTLYFETVNEQTAYCRCLGLCPKPRTSVEEEAFENGWIAIDGFVANLKHRRHLQIDEAKFRSNPLSFVKQLIENRNHSYVSITSHVGSIILNSYKLI